MIKVDDSLLREASRKLSIGGDVATLTLTYPSDELLHAELNTVSLKRAARRCFFKAMGADKDRLLAVSTLLRLCGIFLGDRDALWLDSFENLAEIQQLDACRSMYYLPGPLSDGEAKELGENYEESHFYAGVSLWLCTRYLGISAKAAPLLKELGFNNYEPYATLSEQRFSLIRRLCEVRKEREFEQHQGFIPLSYMPSATPSCYWLLAEAALCRTRFKNVKTGKVTNKDKAYVASAETVRLLNAMAEGKGLDQLEKAGDFDETLNMLERCIEADAVKLASEDEMFKNQYWKNYRRSLEIWNSHARTPKLKPLGLKKKKPGSKLGQKHYKGSRNVK